MEDIMTKTTCGYCGKTHGEHCNEYDNGPEQREEEEARREAQLQWERDVNGSANRY
jgi:hypothetical protein